jgi:hypothetical protein
VRTVWKYPFDVTDRFTVSLPVEHVVVHVDKQDGHACMWIELDDESETVEVAFYVEGTGDRLADDAVWCGTWLDGPFVWHLYEGLQS